MAKRFTDTEKWDDPWFSDMPVIYKLIYIYILDRCDNVGVWKVNKRLVKFHVSSDIDWDVFMSYMGCRIKVLSDEKWWLTKFCTYQYGLLKEDSKSKPVISHINTLKNHRLWIDYTKGIHTLKEKVKEKEQVKEKEKDKEKENSNNDIFREIKTYYPNDSSIAPEVDALLLKASGLMEPEHILMRVKDYAKYCEKNGRWIKEMKNWLGSGDYNRNWLGMIKLEEKQTSKEKGPLDDWVPEL